MTDVAIVGMACRYPDASSPGELWENVLSQRRAFRRLPRERLTLEDFAGSESIATTEAAVLEGYAFDRVAFRVAGPTFRAADHVHWLALEVADAALRDASFPEAEGLPREETGVLVGNTLTGEFSRASTLRLRWPYVQRVVDARLVTEGWDAPRRRSFLERLELSYKEPFPPVDEETLAGGLSNTVAGRICSHFHLGGGGYTLDGACSSSLLAVAQACSALAAGDLDAALAGGVDLSLDPFELVGFSKAGALASDDIRVYDQRAAGFLPGEGCGFVVLMRHEDAAARGLRCYALIRGWGLSSDGGGGVTRPEVEGQRRAIARAYRRAGYGPATVALFEGHGTGTPVGDEVELRALGGALRDAGAAGVPAVVGSIKGNIGHTKAAAGIAGLIKATLAVHHQVMPPTAGHVQPRAELAHAGTPLRVLGTAEPWADQRPLRAGVSSFGFGGINVHVTLEGGAPRRPARLTSDERRLVASAQDAELVMIEGRDAPDLAARVESLRRRAARFSRAEIGDLATALGRRIEGAPFRAAVVAVRGDELEARLALLGERVAAGALPCVEPARGVFAGRVERSPRFAFLFPGQGSPVRLAAGALGRRFDAVAGAYAAADLPREGDPLSTAVAQPAIVAAARAGLALLDALGIAADVAVGHSLGELAALHWAGALGESDLFRLARLRGQIMQEDTGGAMAGVAASPREVERLVDGEPGVVLACFNARQQTVVSGPEAAIANVLARASARGVPATRLPTSHAFHSPLMEPAVARFAEVVERCALGPLRRRVVSTVTGSALAEGADLRTLLVDQLTRPVRFVDALEALPDVDLLVEVGPGHTLAKLAAEATTTPALSLDVGGTSVREALAVAAAAFVLGAPPPRDLLFATRFARPVDLERELTFLANPCERAPRSDRSSAVSTHEEVPADAVEAVEPAANPVEVVRALVAERTELPASAVQAGSRLRGDMHLNSLAVGELVAAAARRLGLDPPGALLDYADATVADVGHALGRLATGPRLAEPPPRLPAGAGTWVQAFTPIEVDAPRPPGARTTAPRGWRLFADAHPFAAALARVVPQWAGGGRIVCLPGGSLDAPYALLLDSARDAGLEGAGGFVIVEQQPLAGGFARTLQREHPGLDVRVVRVPFEERALAWLRDEVEHHSGLVEVSYGPDGTRREPRLLRLPAGEGGTLPVAGADVVLVTGGGKGIAAACARALAEQSGAALALVGRSAPGDDRELDATLVMLEEARVRHLYARADVTDEDALARAVASVQAELGAVTAVLHGAGLNRPTRLRDLNGEALGRTLAPKLLGLRNVLDAVDPARLRLLVAFGSVIGRTGFVGEADYALANAALTRMCEEFQRAHPRCRCLAFESSVWSQIGMGEKLGRVDALTRDGVAPLAPAEGVALFLDLLRRPEAPVVAFASGRLGAHPPLAIDGPPLPILRFLEHPLLHYPGIEVVAEAEVSTASDPYLLDHVLDGQIVLPGVLGLEAMAQAAQALAGTIDAPTFEQVRFDHPIIVPADAAIRVRVAAVRRGDGTVDLVVRSSQTSHQVDHFRARCRFEAPPDARVSPPPGPSLVALDPARDLYGSLLFQTGRFQRLSRYHGLNMSHSCAEVLGGPDTPWFCSYLPQALVLGDAGARDAALHSVQPCVPHLRLLPVGVDRLRAARLNGRGPLLARAREEWHEGDTYSYDLEIADAEGRVLEVWEGLRLRRVADVARHAWREALLGPFVEWRLRDLIPGSRVLVALERNGHEDREARSPRAIGRATGATAVRRRADGRPVVYDVDLDVSTAHSGELTLAVGAFGGVSCDLESVQTSPPRAWDDLLGAEGAPLAAVIAERAAEASSVAATRVWAARECLKKAGLPERALLTLRSVADGGWVCLSAPGAAIATYAARLAAQEQPVVLAVLVGDESCAPMNTATASVSKTPTW